MSSRLKKRILNEQEQQQKRRSLNMNQKLRTLCREVTDVNPKWRRKNPKPEHEPTTFSPREMRQKRKVEGEATSWTYIMHIISLTSLTLVAIVMALGIFGLQPRKGDLDHDEVLVPVCSKKEAEDGQCKLQVPKDSNTDDLNRVSKQQQGSGKHINDNAADDIPNTASSAEPNIGNQPESERLYRNPLSDTKSSDSKCTDTKCSDKSTGTKCADTKCADTKYADTKCADTKCADAKCVDTKCADTKCVDTKCVDTKSTGTKCADTKCVDTKCADTKCADTKCVDTKCADTKCADTKCADTKCADTKCEDTKYADTKCEDTKCEDTKGWAISGNPSSNTQVTDNKTKTVSTSDSNSTRSVDLYKAFDWVPGRPARITDPVDDSNYPYHRLHTFTPRSMMVDGLDVVSVELKRATSAKRSHVRAYLLDDLLSAEECDALRHVHDNHVTALSADPIICFDSLDTLRHHLRHIGKADVIVSRNDFTKDTRCVNSTFSASLRTWGLRWSTGTGFYPGESAFSTVLDRRIQKVTGLTAINGGAYRVVSYLHNVGYKEHTDCSVQGMKGKEDRYATVLVYLDDVQVGGHTYFPELGISIKPKKGRALVWNSMSKDGRCDPTSLHAALPVIKGTKYILQRWYYYDNFPGVSSRPPVPPIPVRLPTQGLVSCDEYRHGSCRLYDIWTYDVVTRW